MTTPLPSSLRKHRQCWRPRHITSKSGLGSTGTTDWCCLPEKIQITCCRARRGSGTHGEGLSTATRGIARMMAACPSGQNCARRARSNFVTHLTVPFLRKLGQPTRRPVETVYACSVVFANGVRGCISILWRFISPRWGIGSIGGAASDTTCKVVQQVARCRPL